MKRLEAAFRCLLRLQPEERLKGGEPDSLHMGVAKVEVGIQDGLRHFTDECSLIRCLLGLSLRLSNSSGYKKRRCLAKTRGSLQMPLEVLQQE